MTDAALSPSPDRRTLLLGGVALTLLAACSGGTGNAQEAEMSQTAPPQTPTDQPVDGQSVDWSSLSQDEWRERLTPEEFRVLRKEGTERAGTSPLDKNWEEGSYVCAGCALPLFTSDMKFDSGTGWPSFFTTIEGAVDTKRDFKMILPRTEYHCSRCGGHQGHVFEDGPSPTNLRYCNNGVALDFVPASEA